MVSVVNESMTMVGGMAYRDGSKLHRFMRDARASHLMSPTTDMLKIWIGRALLGQFWELTNVGGEPDGAPNAGIGYYQEFSLALIPPLWHAIMRKKLAVWDRDFASPGERKIANEINKKVGYDISPDVVKDMKLDVIYS